MVQASRPILPPQLGRNADQLRVQSQPYLDGQIAPDQPIVDLLRLSGVRAVPADRDRRGPGQFVPPHPTPNDVIDGQPLRRGRPLYPRPTLLSPMASPTAGTRRNTCPVAA